MGKMWEIYMKKMFKTHEVVWAIQQILLIIYNFNFD